MPKTRDAFAFREIAKMLTSRKIISDYADFDCYFLNDWHIPIYNFKSHFHTGYIECSDSVSRVIYRVAESITQKITQCDVLKKIREQTVNLESPNFYEVKFNVKQLQATSKVFELEIDRIDKHIARLYRLQENIIKKFANDEAADNFVVKKIRLQIKRIKNLISYYDEIESNFKEILNLILSFKKTAMSTLENLFAKEFGERIRAVRIQEKLKQADVANALEIPLPTYSAYERGIREPPLYVIHRLANLLNISADYLLNTNS